MQRINLYWLYQLGMNVHPTLDIKPETKFRDASFKLWLVSAWLEYLLEDKYVPLTVCKPVGNKLLNALNAVADADPASQAEGEPVDPAAADAVLGHSLSYNITSAAREFEIVLSAELQALATYFVSKKGIYDTTDLIEHADNAFPPSIYSSLTDDMKHDVCQAGRCLAFDLPTAAGFHILRAAESVIRQYYTVVVGTLPKAKARNWGVYIRVLGEHGGDAKILAALGQIKDLQRNPIMHPEVTLDAEDALTIFNMAQGVIVAMVKDIAVRRAANVTALAPVLPALAATT
jgi:hypothetical protein